MANKIKSEDLFEGELFKVLIEEINKAETEVKKLEGNLTNLGKGIKKELQDIKIGDLESINKILSGSKDINKALEQQIQLEKQIADLQAKKEKLQSDINGKAERNRLAEIKLQQAREKAIDDFNKKEQQQAEKQAKKLAKEKKEADDLANAYKRLEKNTRELKNESKRLGAEMLELEKNGKRNTKAYYDLEQQYKKVTKSAQEGDKALKKLDNSVGDSFRNVGNYGKALGGFKQLLERMGLAFGIYQVGQFTKKLIENQVQLDRLKLSLQNVSGSTKEYQSNFAYLRDISLKYGQDLLNIVETYKNFIASTEESNLTLGERRRVYESIVKAGSALALSNDDIQGTLRAVQQMFSKGTVQAEELRQQLGDRLPGAFSLMAKAVGVSEAELGKMMKNGEILTDEVMPKFAILLEQQFGKKATKNLETLSGAWNSFKTNLILTFDQAQKNVDVNKTLAWGIKKIGENLGSLFTGIRHVITTFVLYKTALVALDVRHRILNSNILTVIKNLFKGELSFKSATTAVKGFSSALKSISLVLVIEGLVALYDRIMDVAKGYDLAKAKYLSFKNAQSSGDIKANKFLQRQQKDLNDFKRDLKTKLDLTKENDKKIYEEKVKAKEKDLHDEKKAEIQRLNDIKKSFGKKIELLKKQAKEELIYGGSDVTQAPVADASFKLKHEIYKKNPLAVSEDSRDLHKDYAKALKLHKDYIAYQSGITKANAELTALNYSIDEYNILNSESTKAEEKGKRPRLSHIREVADINTKYKELNELLDENARLLGEVTQAELDYKASKVTEGTNQTIEDVIDDARKYGVVEKDTISKAVKAEVDALTKAEEARYNAISGKFLDKAKFDTEKEMNDLLEWEQKKRRELEEMESDIVRYKAEQTANYKKQGKSDNQIESLLEKDDFIKRSKKALEKYTIDLAIETENKKQEIENRGEQRKATAQIEERGALEEHERKKTEIVEEGVKKRTQAEVDATYEAQLKRLNDIKKLSNSTNDLIQLGMDNYLKLLERNISFVEDKMNRLSQNINYLQQKASEGNITAQESLAKAQKDQLDAEKEKMNYQRSIQRLQLAMTVFNAYNSNVQNAQVGENPFTKTITDISALTAFVGSLPTFYEGTETTIADALGNPMMQGKDGYVVRVDGSEKVLNPYLSAKTGNLTTRDIAQIAEDRLKGKLSYSHENSTASNMWASMQLIDEIQDLKNIIRNKPETNIEMGEIVGGVMKIVESTKVNQTTTRNIHRFNKKI